MSEGKHVDGRKASELRPMEAEVGVIKNARGSAMFKIGKTIALAAVYGPRELHPRHLQDPGKGRLRCHYNMMAFSGHGSRVRPGPSRRSKEISLVTEKALAPVLDLSEYPKTVVDVFIELIQTDAGTRCAGICAASLALADAGMCMKDLVCAVATGIVNDNPVVDLSYEDEASEGAVDIPLAIMPRTGEITLLQLDGVVDKKQFKKAVELGKKGCQKIYKLQQETLRKKYSREEQK